MYNLIFYPTYHKNQYIIKDIDNFLQDNLTIKYELFSYNKNEIKKQENLYECTIEEPQLSVVLNFIKEYTTNNYDKQFNIYFFTDGYSRNHEYINISDYITSNINQFNYIVHRNKYIMGRFDFNDKWLSNPKFIYQPKIDN
jgi:hypothetical protein